jgi:hypothetical protein
MLLLPGVVVVLLVFPVNSPRPGELFLIPIAGVTAVAMVYGLVLKSSGFERSFAERPVVCVSVCECEC